MQKSAKCLIFGSEMVMKNEFFFEKNFFHEKMIFYFLLQNVSKIVLEHSTHLRRPSRSLESCKTNVRVQNHS